MGTGSRKLTLNERRAVELLSRTFAIVSYPQSDTYMSNWVGTVDLLRPRLALAHPQVSVHSCFEPHTLPRFARFAEWTVDLMRRQITHADAVITLLGSAEFTLLTAFLQQPRRTMARDLLARQTCTTHGRASVRTIDVYVSRLRRRLTVTGRHGDLIGTVHLRGYIFNADVVFE